MSKSLLTAHSIQTFIEQTKVQNHLISIQTEFQEDLLSKVGTFQADTMDYYHDYDSVSDVGQFCFSSC